MLRCCYVFRCCNLCYAKDIKHFSCSHRQGHFVVKKRVNNKTIHAHTGTIDNVWKMIKKTLPHSLKNQRCQKARLHESKDLAACSSVAVALGKLKLPRLELAHGLHLLEAPYVKKKQARRCAFTQKWPENGIPEFQKKIWHQNTSKWHKLLVFVGRNETSKIRPLKPWVQ